MQQRCSTTPFSFDRYIACYILKGAIGATTKKRNALPKRDRHTAARHFATHARRRPNGSRRTAKWRNARPFPLPSCCGVRQPHDGDVHRVTRSDHRLHRTAHHRGRPRRRRPHDVGDERLSPCQHGDHAHLRQARRHDRAKAPVRTCAHPVHGRLGRLRHRAQHVLPHRRTRRAGLGRRRPHRAFAGHRRRHLPAQGARQVPWTHGCRLRRELSHRAFGGRRVHRLRGLGMVLLDQRAARAHRAHPVGTLPSHTRRHHAAAREDLRRARNRCHGSGGIMPGHRLELGWESVLVDLRPPSWGSSAPPSSPPSSSSLSNSAQPIR